MLHGFRLSSRIHDCHVRRGAALVAILLRMAVADSTAVFKARALAGLVSDDYDKFKSAGLDTMALFAFSCNYVKNLSLISSPNFWGVCPLAGSSLRATWP